MTSGIAALVRKDLLRQVLDRKGLVIYLVAPLVLTGIMGLSFGGGIFGGSGISAIPIALSGGDLPGGLKDQLTRGLRKSGFFDVAWVDSTTAMDRVERGEAKAAIILPDDVLDRMFSEETVTFHLYKDPNSVVKAGIVEGILTSMMTNYQAHEAAYRALWPEDDLAAFSDSKGPLADFMSGNPRRILQALRDDGSALRTTMLDYVERSAVFVETVAEPAIKLSIHDRQGWAAETETRGSRNLYDYFLPSFAVFFMMWGAAGVVRELHRERENRTLARVLCGPVSVRTVVVSKWLTAVVVGTAQLLLLLLCGGLMFGVNVTGAPLAIVLTALLTGAAAASVYLVLGLLVKTEKALDGLATIFTLVCGMLGGNFFPLDMMPPTLRFAGMGTFNYWANRAFADLITHGQQLASVRWELLALVVIAIVGLMFAVALFDLRQRKGVVA